MLVIQKLKDMLENKEDESRINNFIDTYLRDGIFPLMVVILEWSTPHKIEIAADFFIRNNYYDIFLRITILNIKTRDIEIKIENHSDGNKYLDFRDYSLIKNWLKSALFSEITVKNMTFDPPALALKGVKHDHYMCD